MNNFIDIEDIDSNQLKKIMAFSAGLKAERKNISKGTKDFKKYLTNKVVALIFKKPSIELHISNIYKREEFRQKSLISGVVTGGIFGLGTNGYILAIIAIHKILKK